MKLAEQQFVPVVEGVYELTDLVEADDIFLTSANLGVALVTTFDFPPRYSVTTEKLFRQDFGRRFAIRFEPHRDARESLRGPQQVRTASD